MRRLISAILALAIAFGMAPSAHALVLATDDVNERTALALLNQDGEIEGTDNADEPRPALSLSKLYLGYWVIYNGSKKHKAQVEKMLRLSHDGLAQEMDRAYPEAIDEIAEDFDLEDTSRNGYWGSAPTSAVDVVKFIQAISPDPQAKPVFDAMRDSAEIAQDGFEQDFGTFQLPGAEGTKFGWSNNHESMATVSFGDGWIAAALTDGDTSAINKDTLKGFIPAVEMDTDDLTLAAERGRFERGRVQNVDDLLEQAEVDAETELHLSLLGHGWLNSIGAAQPVYELPGVELN